MVILIWLILLGLVFFSLSRPTVEDILLSDTTVVNVKKHETLWDIASKINDGTYNNHIVIEAIRKMNNMEKVIIRPGQKLKVPILNKK